MPRQSRDPIHGLINKSTMSDFWFWVWLRFFHSILPTLNTKSFCLSLAIHYCLNCCVRPSVIDRLFRLTTLTGFIDDLLLVGHFLRTDIHVACFKENPVIDLALCRAHQDGYFWFVQHVTCRWTNWSVNLNRCTIHLASWFSADDDQCNVVLLDIFLASVE